MIYANNAGTSWPKPPEVHAAVADALAAEPTRYAEILGLARTEVCRFLGITNEERFLFTPGCTAALSIAFEDLPWRAGDVVITSSLEHHAVVRPVKNLVAERGVVHEAAPYRAGEPIDLDFVRDVLRRGGVRLIAVSAASNVTGEILPVADLARLAHEHDALCLVDAAQVVGVVPVAVAALGADILTFAGHKGPLGPQGIGGLWAADHIRFESLAASCEIGGGGVGSPRDECMPFPDYCVAGGANVAGAAGVAAGMRWLRNELGEQMGVDARRLAEKLRSAFEVRDYCRVFGGSPHGSTAVVSFIHDGLPLAAAEQFFAAHDIVVRAGQHCAPMALDAIGAREGTIRLSLGAFSRDTDVDRIVSSVESAPAR